VQGEVKRGYDADVFGLFDRFGGKKRAEAQAKKKELAGDLERATELYVDAEQPAEAARLLLLRADAMSDPQQRMVLCAQAARVGEDSEIGQEAQRRKARIGFDMVKGSQGATMHGELVRVAAELEACGDWEAAAEAFRMAGDTDAEIRVLKEAGAIEALEERLRVTSQSAKKERDRAQLLRRMRDLDSIAERRVALRAGLDWLERERDEQVELEVERIRNKLVHGPSVDLVVHGLATTYVLGGQITLGRARADIVVHSSSVSRQHLRLYRDGTTPMMEDLATRNGSTLAGARISGSMPIGAGLSLELAGQVPCRIEPVFADEPEGPIAVQIAGGHYIVPLGPMRIGGWTLVDAHHGEDRFVVLRTLEGRDPPHRAGYRLAHEIELCEGDEICDERGGDVVIAVPIPKARPSLAGAP
jgi:FHA domain